MRRGTSTGRRLMAHELSHVMQRSVPSTPTLGTGELLSVKAVYGHPLADVHLKPDDKPKSSKTEHQDVAIIVGRPSQTIESKEKSNEKEEMEIWRASARALAPIVLEGLTVDKAFAGLKNIEMPIGKLYIIGHSDISGIGEVGESGVSVSTTVAVEDVTRRIKTASGPLGDRAPHSVEMLSCFGGSSPKTIGKISQAVGAPTIRAPVWTTVISGRIINLKILQR